MRRSCDSFSSLTSVATSIASRSSINSRTKLYSNRDFQKYIAILEEDILRNSNHCYTIDKKIIEFIITTLYQDGRIAISQRLYNKLIHTNDPRITNNLDTEDDGKNINESKSYSNFYNSWKKYTKTGVTL
jgi:hypothetical protein